MTTAEVSASSGDASKSSELDRALELLKGALGILDKIDVPPEIGARLAEVIAAIEEQR